MKKHSHEEIISKLDRADELARAGKSQVEIGKALGVSVMTLHRWRKRPSPKKDARPPHNPVAEEKMLTRSSTMDDMRRVLEELGLENQRLRKMATDLLRRKRGLEEPSPPPGVDRHARADSKFVQPNWCAGQKSLRSQPRESGGLRHSQHEDQVIGAAWPEGRLRSGLIRTGPRHSLRKCPAMVEEAMTDSMLKRSPRWA